ncbi:dual 3',5'-cyclic-AMP and -GMP phosphodiesterase 11 [Caerostris extrusa]|uniref:Dual 3',5'-cyclic-AMP and -GMP phosphodiesterase 11 n=1 Tax=Caerostris extrusa TaxID=172846 RepID=A0AAV4QLY8_CAEEX|nr:dual 3',5'-cyclic-AMP and -GMP phosphodiesterase 11 [Caerostris extrusa]
MLPLTCRPVLNATSDGIPTFWSRLLQSWHHALFVIVTWSRKHYGSYGMNRSSSSNWSTTSAPTLVFAAAASKGDPNRCLVRELFNVSCNSIAEQIQRNDEICIPWGIYIVGHVGEYGESLNISDCYKKFAIFWNLDIQHDRLFERASQSIAETKRKSYSFNSKMYKLHDLKFDDFSLNDKEMLKACIRMFMDLGFIQRFRIEYDVLCRWLLSVRKNYRPVSHDNWRHAFNVTQMMFAILTVSKLDHVLGELETLSLLIACLCHDLDHRGINNSFLKKAMLLTACDIGAITKTVGNTKKDC